MSDAYLIPIYIALIGVFYLFYCWLLRRVVDPDGDMRELPLPGYLRWAAIVFAIFSPTVAIMALSLVISGITALL